MQFCGDLCSSERGKETAGILRRIHSWVVIGGYQEGGDQEWSSYSPHFGMPVLILLRQAENALSGAGFPTVWLWSLVSMGVLLLGWATLGLARSRRAGPARRHARL